MPRTPRHLAVLILMLIAFLSGPILASAQVATGTPPFGSFGGGPDIINLANLNTHLNFPLYKKAGRGLPFDLYMTYDSSVWYPLGASGQQMWGPVSNFGWDASEVRIGTVTHKMSTLQHICGVKPNQGHETITTYSNWAYVDGFGTSHGFSGATTVTLGTCGDNGSTSLSGLAPDGSGYSISVTGATVNSLHGPDGSSIGSSSIIDRNGNTISSNGSGNFTDTLGVVVLTTSGSTSAPPVKYSYTAPSGATANIVVNYTNFTVATNFGISNISEYKSAAAVPLVSSIVLPDNSQYTITYEPTPSTPTTTACTPYAGTTCVTARIHTIQFPTGGTITYTYSGGNNGILPDGSTATLTRATPDGTWTYAQVKNTGAASTTTVTAPQLPYDPSTNQTVIQFQGIHETQRQAYQGSSSSGALLKTINTCYNASASPCIAIAIAAPITQRTIMDILPGSSNLQSQHIYKYASSGSLTEQDDYDYGSGAPGALLKKTAITYASLGSITKFRQQITVTNGAGTVISQTNNNYDETAVIATTGTPQHGSVTASRGNLTSTNYYTQGTSFLTTRSTYFDTGKVQTTTDANGGVTTYNYPDAVSTCGNAFPTSITEAITTLSRSMSWNCTGGVQLTSADENGQATTTAYSDADYWRPASVTDPLGNQKVYYYQPNATYPSYEIAWTMGFNSGNSAASDFQYLDGLGRTYVDQHEQSPGSSSLDSVSYTFDSNGRPYSVSMPCVISWGGTCSTPQKTQTYDALGRTTKISDNSTGYRSFAYSQNDVYVTRGPAPTGENMKRRQEEFDGLGRLTSVCEITSASDGGSCGQQSPQTGYWTKYAYDALGRLTGVTQNAQAASASQQSRTYAYDLLGRLTSETNPESGTTTYVYDTDSVCGTSSGDRVKRTDAIGNVTCYAYDALHRPTSVTYPSGSYASVTASKHYVYDAATVDGQTMYYAKGRLAEAYTCLSTCTSPYNTDIGFNHNARGEVGDIYESTPHSGGYNHVFETYWANGLPHQVNTYFPMPNVTYQVDGEGRPYSVSDSGGNTVVSSTTYNAASLPTLLTYGSGDSDSFTFDPNTNWITQYKFTVNSQSLTGALTWNADHTLQSMNITDPFNSSDTQNCAFGYDDLTRLSSANCGSIMSQTFSYDAFGNLSKSGTYSFQPVYKNTSGYTNNKYVSLPGVTVSYDANGNVLTDGAHSYTWDSAGKSITADSVGLTYDALGRMVEQNRSGVYTQIVYAANGAKLAILSGSTLQKGFAPLPGGAVAVYNSSGPLYYGHPDHLGSIRLGSTPSKSVYFDMAFAPFGEPYAALGTTDPSFTGQRQDTAPGLYDFPAREYGTQGRWPAPDPSGLASMHLNDPQTLNRYAYVRNNPLVMIDPQGLDEADACGSDDGDTCFFPSQNGGGGGASGGGGAGGSWDPTSGGAPSNSGTDCPPFGATCGGPIDDSGAGTLTDTPLEDQTPTDSLTMLSFDDSGQISLLTNSLEGLVPGWSSQSPNDQTNSYADWALQQIAPGIVSGAGGIADPTFALGFWAVSAVGGATASAGALWELGSAAYTDFGANLATWQTFDPIGYGEAVDFFGHWLPTAPGVTSTGAGAAMGLMLGNLWNPVTP
jgi:RHS repeat-associated protein